MRSALKPISIVYLLFLTSLNLLLAQIPSEYEVATWKGFTEAAASYTWDDNTPNHIPVAAPLFDRYDFKATFFIVTNTVNNWEEFRRIADEGHEVASHTLTHSNFPDIDTAQRRSELRDAKDTILHYIPDHPVYTFAYPFCQVGTDEQTEEFYISARICSRGNETTTPANFMQVNAHVVGEPGNIVTTADFNEQVNLAIADKGWSVFVLHGIDSGGDFLVVTTSILEQHLQFLDARRDSVWVGTYGEVVRYIKERDAATIEETETTDTSFVFSLTHNLPIDIYNYPLSVQRSLPLDWDTITVTQDSLSLDFTRFVEDSLQYIRFDAIPNGGNIQISKPAPDISKSTTPTNEALAWNVYPNPAHTEATISFSLKRRAIVTFQVIDATGRIVKEMRAKKFSSGAHSLNFSTLELAAAHYRLLVHVNGQTASKPFLVER